MGGRICWAVSLIGLLGSTAMGAGIDDQTLTKAGSSLYPPEIVETLRYNVAHAPWVAGLRDELVEKARWWMERSDDELWALMFGPTITRSWMVWSNGHCPACGKPVPMYNWEMDALGRPWKTRCPHCSALFPTNDFHAFHQSGLDEHGLFDPARANRSLLFNVEHPDADDPLRLFGVDDGEGYVDGDKRWRFIGAYLIYGQWKQAVVGGIRALSAAYLLTGDPAYAHKAGVLLDRVADLYPAFDFGKQALVYERQGDRGYVSTWHDACEETREMVMAYDMIFGALCEDADLVAFLSKKAGDYGIENPKASFQDIQRNIEGRILRDALANRTKIVTNYPRTEICEAITLAVLGWPENRDAFYAIVDPTLERATAVDGVTGEKGLAGYTCFTLRALALFLAEFSKANPGFLADLLERHPRLKETFRFHIDTYCLGRYYPLSGDTGSFAAAVDSYLAMNFVKPGFSVKDFSYWTFLPPSSYSLLWKFYELTKDPAYVQVMYAENGNSLEGIPHDLYLREPEQLRTEVRAVLDAEGTDIKLPSVNKQQWRIAILRSGEGKDARAAWLDYDSGGGHGHADGMNLGLFAKGLDLMPDFGYPPVQFGGWGSPRARWYTMSAAHNTVVVDGRNSGNGGGETTLWADGRYVHAIRVAGPAMNQGKRYERTIMMVDVSPGDFYLVDVFRVAGGTDHTKFMHSHFGEVALSGLSVADAPDYGHDTQMRNVRLDAKPQPGWHADWQLDDRYHYLPEDTPPLHLRYTDFTTGVQAGLVDAWIVAGLFSSSEETWIPRVLVRRQSAEGQTLESTFVGVIEPYAAEPVAKAIARVPLLTHNGEALSDSHVALSIALADGRHDTIVLRDPEAMEEKNVTAKSTPETTTSAELALFRLGRDGKMEYAASCTGNAFHEEEHPGGR